MIEPSVSTSNISDNESELEICTPPSVVDAANAASNNILPQKSRERYEFVYKKFMDWCKDNHTHSFSENVLLAYIGNLSKELKPSTLWSMYSMLRSTIQLKHNVDIAKYAKLKAFLKRKSTGFTSKKAQVLSAEQIKTFINEAPDEKFLFTKVALIFGIAGACRTHELKDLESNNVQDLEKAFLVSIPHTKTNVPRSFTIVGAHYDICKKYINLRTPGINNTISRFFVNYQNGKCTKQAVGINKLGDVPKQVAKFLNLPHPEQFTGHSLRRSSTTVLANTGANLVEIKQHGGWKSSAVAETYIEDSINNKIQRGQKIFNSLTNQSQPVNLQMDFLPAPPSGGANTTPTIPATINNYYNCTFLNDK